MQIADAAEVSVSSAQKFFRSKEGLITAPAQIMFARQLGGAEVRKKEPPARLPVPVGTAIELFPPAGALFRARFF